MNLRNAKKTIYQALSEYNINFNTNIKLDDIIFITDSKIHDTAYIDAEESYYNHKYILNIKQSLFDNKSHFIKAILFHEFTHISDTLLFVNYPELHYKELMKIYSEIHATEVEMDVILSYQNKPYSLKKNIWYIAELPLEDYLSISLNSTKDVFTLPNEMLSEHNAPFNYEELYYYIGKIRSINKNHITYYVDYEKELSSINKPFQNLLYEIINYGIKSDLKDFDKLIQLQEKLTSTIYDFIKKHNAKFS